MRVVSLSSTNLVVCAGARATQRLRAEGFHPELFDTLVGASGGRVPDRNDFLELETRERIRQWHRVMDRCRLLADDLNDLLDGNRLADALSPYPV